MRYLKSSRISKDEAAREILQSHPLEEGLAAVLQCVEPCWTFDVKSVDGRLKVVGEAGKCSMLYRYFRHPLFGWMYVRLQTWFPFEVQIGINGREWLAQRMDREGMKYRRCDNKFLWVEDWQRAQVWLDEQLRTNWVKEFNGLLAQVHPLHPGHLGRLPVAYNWTVHQEPRPHKIFAGCKSMFLSSMSTSADVNHRDTEDTEKNKSMFLSSVPSVSLWLKPSVSVASV